MSARRVDLTQGPLLRGALYLAVPAALQAFVTHLYGLQDYFFVGRLGDAEQTAALSAAFGVLLVQQTLLAMMGFGASTLIAQQTGRGREDDVGHTFAQAALGAVVSGLVLGALCALLLDGLLALANVTEGVAGHARRYVGVLLLASPVIALLRVVQGTYRARGNTTVPLRLEVLALTINAVASAGLTWGLWGLPRLEILGAALGTSLSFVLPTLLALRWIVRGGLGFCVGASSWVRVDLGCQRALVRIGAFASLAGVVYGVIYFLLNRLAGVLGPEAQGGLGVGLRGVEWIAFAIAEGFLIACMPWMGQNLGAGDWRRALRGTWALAGLSAVGVQTIGVAFFVAPEWLAAWVAPDAETLGYAVRYLWIMSFAMWAVGVEMVLYGALIGAGLTRQALVLSLVTNGVRIPLACWMLFGPEVWAGVAWTLGMTGEPPPATGTFDAIAWAIALSAMVKALAYALWVRLWDWERWSARLTLQATRWEPTQRDGVERRGGVGTGHVRAEQARGGDP